MEDQPTLYPGLRLGWSAAGEALIPSTSKTVLLADIGGTNARFALWRDGQLGPVAHFAVADFQTAASAMSTFLNRQESDVPLTRPDAMTIDSMVLGVAGPVEGNRCDIINSHWQIDGTRLHADFGLSSIRVLNDFEALAFSLPRLTSADVVPLGGGRARAGAPMLVLGPGTGFGAACLVPQDTASCAVGSEAGHATMPGASPHEDEVIAWLRQRHGHVSIERVLSGGGLENLYDAIAAIDGVSVVSRDARAIIAAARDGRCAVSRAALDMFCALLGEVAGNLALTFRARGGVFIGGGMAPRISDELARSRFRARFEAKGRFHDYLAAVPTEIIVRPDAAFAGLSAIAGEMG